jgi:hypothetical protein
MEVATTTPRGSARNIAAEAVVAEAVEAVEAVEAEAEAKAVEAKEVEAKAAAAKPTAEKEAMVKEGMGAREAPLHHMRPRRQGRGCDQITRRGGERWRWRRYGRQVSAYCRAPMWSSNGEQSGAEIKELRGAYQERSRPISAIQPEIVHKKGAG